MSSTRLVLSGPPAPLQSSGARHLARRAAAALVAGVLAGAVACAEAPEASSPLAAAPDAAAACESGAEGCACLGGSGCREGLVCIARRCLGTEGPEDTTPPARPRPPPASPSLTPGPAPAASTRDAGDAGAADAALDAGG